VTRNVTSFLLLGILLAGQGAPLAANGLNCPMSRSAAAKACAVCAVPGGAERRASVAAGSCCRFEAASPTAQTPGVVPAAPRCQNTAVSGAARSGSTLDGAFFLPRPDGANLSPPRSTDSPLSLRNTLRL
jgi:hypothetical protein